MEFPRSISIRLWYSLIWYFDQNRQFREVFLSGEEEKNIKNIIKVGIEKWVVSEKKNKNRTTQRTECQHVDINSPVSNKEMNSQGHSLRLLTSTTCVYLYINVYATWHNGNINQGHPPTQPPTHLLIHTHTSINMDWPLTSLQSLMGAPLLINRSAERWPFGIFPQKWRGVSLSFPAFKQTSAPAPSRTSTTSGFPDWTARWRAVNPSCTW